MKMMLAIGMYVFGFLTHVVFATDQRNKRLRSTGSRGVAASSTQFKMVLVVNNSLKMGKGKIGETFVHATFVGTHFVLAKKLERMLCAGAQCAHAAVGAVERAPDELIVRWKSQGQPKVCLQAQQDVVLLLERQARAKGMTCCLVRDAGRTQIAPGSKTVLAIGPDTIDNIDELTRSLRLL